MFTLREALDQLGYNSGDKHTNWSLGAALREEYRRVHGRLPDKQLDNKQAGAGSHCFARYPDSFRDSAEQLIHAHMDFQARQGDMFA